MMWTSTTMKTRKDLRFATYARLPSLCCVPAALLSFPAAVSKALADFTFTSSAWASSSNLMERLVGTRIVAPSASVLKLFSMLLREFLA